MLRIVSPCLLALLATACTGPAPREQTAAETPDGNGIQAQVAGDMAAIRLKVAEDRIAQLERQVGEMQAKPEKLDLQLLTQRIEQVEARVYAQGATPVAKDGAALARRPEPQPTPSPSPAPNRFNPFGL